MDSISITDTSFFRRKTFKELIEDGKGDRCPKELYKSLFHKYDLGILFGPPECNKDLLATMIGEAICKKFDECGDKESTALYLDLEKSDLQQVLRYTDSTTEKAHEFSERLIRQTYSDIGWNKITVDNLYKGLAKAIVQTKVSVVIIDNLTYLCRGQMGSLAAEFLEMFKFLQQAYDVSFLVLVHIQRLDNFKPITLKDLKGSCFIPSMADSIFAMNISRRDKDIRYVKQLKSGCSEIEYGSDNVLVYKKERDADGGLCLNFVGTTPEDEQLDIDYEAEQELVKEIRRLHYKHWSIRRIAKKFNISRMQVWRSLQ